MDSICRFGLHPPRKNTQTHDQGMVDMTSFRDTLIALSGSHAAEAQLYQTDNTLSYPEYIDDNASISSGSL